VDEGIAPETLVEIAEEEVAGAVSGDVPEVVGELRPADRGHPSRLDESGDLGGRISAEEGACLRLVLDHPEILAAEGPDAPLDEMDEFVRRGVESLCGVARIAVYVKHLDFVRMPAVPGEGLLLGELVVGAEEAGYEGPLGHESVPDVQHEEVHPRIAVDLVGNGPEDGRVLLDDAHRGIGWSGVL